MAQCLRLICFLIIVILVFITIYTTYGAAWTRFVPHSAAGGLANNDEKYNTLWRRCRQASASINEVCDMYGSRNSGTGTSTVLAWRSLMMCSIVLLIAAASCCALSLECVLLTHQKKLMGVTTSILCISAGIFIMIVCVWNTITELHPYYANYSETGGLYKSRSDVSDAYEATPGDGLVMSYLSAAFAFIIAILSGCWATDDDTSDDAATSIGMPRATLLSAISGIAGIPGIAAPSVYQRARNGERPSRESQMLLGTRRPSMPMSMLSGAVPGMYPANQKYVPDNFSRAAPAAYMADPRQTKLDEEGYI